MKKTKATGRSPFSKEFWIKKGYSEEEAEFKRNSIRPIRKEYWMNKGYEEDAAIEKAKQTKKENDLKAALKTKNRSKKQHRESSIRCVEFWLKKGYSEEDAKQKVHEVQSTFSLEKCISEHGLIEGTKKWKRRQEKWQKTIKSKGEKEIEKINKKKNAISIKHYDTIEECVENLKKNRNMDLVISEDDFIKKVSEDIKKNPYKKYMPVECYIEKYVQKIQIEIFQEFKIDYKKSIEHFFEHDVFFDTRSNRQAYRRWSDGNYLRSSYEIYFYDKLKEKFPDTIILTNNQYPESSFYYDFKVFDYYIEICPMMLTNEKYKQKMLHKQKTFGCVLLKTVEEMDNFLENLCNE